MKEVLLVVGIMGVAILGSIYSWGDITGASEVDEWVNITITNWNALMVGSLIIIGGCSGYLVHKAVKGFRHSLHSKGD